LKYHDIFLEFYPITADVIFSLICQCTWSH